MGAELNGEQREGKKRTNRPEKMASRKCQKFISNTAAASTNSLNGVGGGNMAGNIKAQNS